MLTWLDRRFISILSKTKPHFGPIVFSKWPIFSFFCLTRCREMVSEPDHFSFRSDFLEKYLADLKNFSSFEIVVCSSFKCKILKFRKRSNFQLWLLFSHLSANRIFENKVANVIQHIRKPISVRKFKKITRESKNGQVHWPSRGNAMYQLHGNGLTRLKLWVFWDSVFISIWAST